MIAVRTSVEIDRRPAGRAAMRPCLALSWLALAVVAASLLGCAGSTRAQQRAVSSAAGGASRSAQVPAETAPRVHGHLLRDRLVWVQANLQVDANMSRLEDLLDRAAAAQYTGIVLSDVKLGRLFDGSLPARYQRNLASLLERANELGLEVLPATASFGYSEPLLWHDPSLAEALPLRGVPFKVEGGLLVPHEPDGPALANADFEDLPADGHAFPGWRFQDAPGAATFVDRTVRRSGEASLRMQDLGETNAPHGNGRVYQELAVEPWRSYRASVWVRTEGLRGGEVRLAVLADAPSRSLQHNPIPVQETQDWTRFDATFNTLSHDRVRLYFGVWGGRQGRIWWDDGLVEPAGFVNVVRRPGAPLDLWRSSDGRALVEGVDVARVEDPLMGMAAGWPGTYDAWHAPPSIAVPPGSSLREGDVVEADFYQTSTIHGSQVAASLTEPAVFEIVARQLESTRDAFAASDAFQGWMLSHDEIRMHGWDESPRYGDGSPGANLAWSFRRVTEIARDLAPAARLLVWSDMFDAHHNAAPREEPYYLVNGDWSGSWAGLPPDVVLLNWNQRPGVRRLSAEHFAALGNPQILAGYYDAAPADFDDRDWLADLAGLPGVRGVMYTPWYTGHDRLEEWAEHVWGGAEWEPVGGATPAASASPSPPTAPITPMPPEPRRLWLPALGRGAPGPVQDEIRGRPARAVGQ